MKECKSYKELKKISRKYWKRNARKTVNWLNNKKIVGYWTDNIWCYYIAKHIEDYHKEGFKYDIDPRDLNEFIKKVNSLIGKSVKVGDTTGKLLGIAFTNNGAYYAIKNDNETVLMGLIDIEENKEA